jgi:hypothetical protein
MDINEHDAADIVRRGEAIYENELRILVEAGNKGKYLVLDVETKDYIIASEYLHSSLRLRERRPNALIFAMRIGYPALGRIGGGSLSCVP